MPHKAHCFWEAINMLPSLLAAGRVSHSLPWQDLIDIGQHTHVHQSVFHTPQHNRFGHGGGSHNSIPQVASKWDDGDVLTGLLRPDENSL